MQGIHEAASQPGGTSADVWTGWNQEQHPGVRQDRAPPNARGKSNSPGTCASSATPSDPIVIAVTVEEGGFGAETAAPIARLIASKWFGQPEKFVAGTSKTF